MTHQVVKAEKIAATAAVLLEQNLVIPAVFQREGIEQYKGAKGDAINVKVEGVLPFHTYGWRNDRSTEIQFDEYSERTLQVTFGDDIYSGVQLTDEQSEMDLDGWTKLARKQTEAIGRGLEYKAVDYLKAAPYEVTVGVSKEKLKQGLIEARRVFRALHVPAGSWTMLVGTDWESALLNDPQLSSAQNIGESEASGALTEATLFKRYGFNFVVTQELDPADAVALVDSAFIFATGAPGVPQSVAFGSSASYNGVALRWLRDYDMLHTRDRSLFNTYQGFRSVSDDLVGRDSTSGQAFVSSYEHFVRAIKLKLTDTEANAVTASKYPDGTKTGTTDPIKKEVELAKLTGLKPRTALV